MIRMKRLVLIILLLAVAITGPAAAVGAADGAAKVIPRYQNFSELSGKRVSMLTGEPFEELVLSKVPDVGEFSYLTSMADMMLALRSDKTDAILMNNAVSLLAVNRNPDLTLFPQNLKDGVFGLAFEKDSPERDAWQAAFDAIPEEELQTAWEKWTGADESLKEMPKQDWPGSNGTVEVAACDTLEPMSYAGEGGELKGFDLEVILMMAKALDVHVKFTGMESSAVLSYVQSGKALIGAGSIIVTDERREAVDFIEYFPAAFVLIVRDEQAGYEANEANSGIQGLEYLAHGRAAIQTGTINGDVTREIFPDATLEYYNTQADCLVALQTGKVDFWPIEEPISRYMTAGMEDLTIAASFDSSELAAVFAKTDSGRKLCDQYSTFVDGLWEDGTMEEIDSIWFGTDEDKKTVLDYEHLPATNGTLRLATENTMPPFSYVKGNRTVGYDIDIAARFCEENGYGLEVVPMNFDGMLPAIQSGKCDFADSCITVTEERAQSVLFSSPNYHSSYTIVIRKEADGTGTAADAGGSIPEDMERSGIAASFYKTFIREARWLLFIGGIDTTLIITVLSIIFGTLLGFGVFMLCRTGNPVANSITRFCLWMVKGMPMVVLLMILYYVVFGNVSINGIAVAVIGFTFTFGAGVFGLLKMGVGAVDGGQYEAAYALGYSDRRTFFRIILPQALPHIMPAYKGEVVELIKATAIVGYIAVQDVTKIGDIVRSRTYEAFFPLIALTIIYFVLEGLLGYAVSRIDANIDPKRRRREEILKGVKTDDQN